MTTPIFGYVASLFIGTCLGLVGGGGSILTVPVLVYLLGVEPVLATACSLFIVGTTSLVGAIPKYRSGLVDLKVALIYGAPSIIAVYTTRKFLIPAVPHEIVHVGAFVLTKPVLIMLIFAVLMLLASISMIRGQKITIGTAPERPPHYLARVVVSGTLVGILTGMVGAGGGFLIIPTLVVACRVPMKQAVGTSLLIIAAKSLIGFLGDVNMYPIVDWALLFTVLAIAIAGIFIGNYIHLRVSDGKLRIFFGWFVLVLGVYILYREFLPLLVAGHSS
jgi:hypothetical protein